ATIQHYEELATAKGITLNTTINSQLQVRIDPQIFRGILSNLLDNATKYCERGDSILLTIKLLDQHLLINVSDTGIGMSEERKNTLFSFEHIETKRGTSGEKGAGFGLILVHELVKTYDGSIEVISQEGEGSMFEVRLPNIV
ncbi:MAG: HAMP domain-containing sensor histidine kinase, partial [Bacteroidota bacterium]